MGEPIFSGGLFGIRREQVRLFIETHCFGGRFADALCYVETLNNPGNSLNNRSVKTAKHSAHLHGPSRVNSRQRSDEREVNTHMSGNI